MISDIFKEVPSLSEQDRLLSELYERTGRTLDDLLYTADFEELSGQFASRFPGWKEREIADRLFRLRKAGLLPRPGQAWSASPTMLDEDVVLLESLVRKYAGTVGRRDQLPYAPEFDKLVEEFNQQRPGPPLGAHGVWRLVARIAK